MIRPVRGSDVSALVALAQSTGVFRPVELAVLREVLEDFLQKPWGDSYHAYALERDGCAVAFSIHGPDTMTDRTWDLYWIAVDPLQQGKGIGSELLRFVEADLRAKDARLVMVETSSLPSYAATRRFYLKHGYEQVAVAPDFYADGDSKVLFCKRMAALSAPG